LKQYPELDYLARGRITLFSNSPSDPSLFNHKLGGKLKGKRAFRINFQYRIIFEITPDGHAVFDDVGDHDEVY
jgi:mRNA-degrading endonuclease YafQ of YafQ-DinJ toxin-antitoxin module